ncbi:MAG: 23S rRNA (pseudouridine(1915)-N(3))-methyltransferase RlmH [Patescibacteria group bacterium]
MITVLSIGKKHEEWVQAGIERYERRLRQPFDVQWVLLPHSSLEGRQARLEESERILSRLHDDAYVVLLDETGRMVDSPELSRLIDVQHVGAKAVTIVIGGAYGVDERIHARANMVLSLSKLVFPHQLVRLIVIEQLYRAQEISRGGRYHHE